MSLRFAMLVIFLTSLSARADLGKDLIGTWKNSSTACSDGSVANISHEYLSLAFDGFTINFTNARPDCTVTYREPYQFNTRELKWAVKSLATTCGGYTSLHTVNPPEQNLVKVSVSGNQLVFALEVAGNGPCPVGSNLIISFDKE